MPEFDVFQAGISFVEWRIYILPPALKLRGGQSTQLRINFNHVAIVLVSLILLEGLAIAFNVGEVIIVGLGTIGGTRVMVAGLQLAIIGAAVFMAISWTEHAQRNDLLGKIISVIPPLGGAVILVEGLVVAYLAAPIIIQGVGSVSGIYVSAFGAQLFLSGLGLLVIWAFRLRGSIGLLVSLAALAIISSAVIWVVSVAERLTWAGVGGLSATTILMAGALLVMMGLAGTIFYYLEGRNPHGDRSSEMETWSWGVLVLGLTVAIAGAIVTGLSGKITLEGETSFQESTVMLAGLGLYMLGLLTFLPTMLSQGMA